MKRLFVSLLTLLCLGVAAVEPRKTELKIDVYEWGDDTVVVAARGWSEQAVRYDTLTVRNGKLTYVAVLGEPTAVVVTPLRAMVARVRTRGWYAPQSLSVATLLLPGSTQRINGWVDDHGLLDYKASGSDRYFADAAAVRSLALPYRAKIDTIERRLIVAGQDKLNAWYDRRKEAFGLLDSVQLVFLTRFPSSPASGELLASARYTDRFFDCEKRLSPKVRQGLFKAQIDEWVARERTYLAVQQAKQEVVVGAEAPPIELPDSSGVVRRLDELKGKWVVVDFWGSWCGWCLRGIPAMKNAYEKHRSVVEFVGVACNDKPDKWRAAIEQYALPWVNLFEELKGEQAAHTVYGVEAFPTKLLIDPEGKIAYKAVGEDPAFYLQLDELLRKRTEQ